MTRGAPDRRRVGAILVAITIWSGSCGVPTDRDAHVVAAQDVPFGLLDSTTTTVADPAVGGARDTTVCLPVEGSLLSLPREGGSDSLLALVIGGPTEGEAKVGLRSAVDDETVSEVTRSGTVARVNLTEAFAELPGDQQLVAVAQVTCTLTAQPGIERVRFQLAGDPVEVPIQGGSLVARPVGRVDYERLLAN